jgi:quinoprotein glucose dehydrogenase
VLNGFPNAQFDVTSPVTIYKDLAIAGGQIQESPGTGASGDPRAFDVHTGKLVWRFHSVPHPGETGNDTWEGSSWKNRSGTNVWGFMSVDLERGLIFLPFGSPAYDFYGADRKGKNRLRSTPIPENWRGIFKSFITTLGTTIWNRLRC